MQPTKSTQGRLLHTTNANSIHRLFGLVFQTNQRLWNHLNSWELMFMDKTNSWGCKFIGKGEL